MGIGTFPVSSANEIRVAARNRTYAVGYCLVDPDGYLAEFDLLPRAWAVKARPFAALVATHALRGARCYSFDSLLLGLWFRIGQGCSTRTRRAMTSHETLEFEGLVRA